MLADRCWLGRTPASTAFVPAIFQSRAQALKCIRAPNAKDVIMLRSAWLPNQQLNKDRYNLHNQILYKELLKSKRRLSLLLQQLLPVKGHA